MNTITRRYKILEENYQHLQQECDNLTQMAKIVGCTKQWISHQLKTNLTWFKHKGIIYQVRDNSIDID